MNKRRTGVVASYVYSIVQVAVNLIYVPLLLGGIGQSEYGLYQMIGSLVAYLSIINTTFSAGATRFYCKYYALNDEDGMANTLGLLKRIYHIAYLVVAAASLVLMIVLQAVYKDSFSPREIQESCLMLAILGANLMLTMSNTISIACITAHEEFAFLKGTQLVTLVIQPIIIVALINFYPFAYTVTLVQFICNFLCLLVQKWFARNKLKMDDKLRFLDRDMEHQILSFSGTLLLAVVADQVFWKSDQLILGYLYGTDSVAVYSVGSQVVNAYMPLGTAVSSVFMPKVSEIWHKNRDLQSLSDLFVKVSRIALYPLLAVLLGFIVFGVDFIHLWAGQGFGLAWWVTVIELVPFTIDVSQNIGLTILQVMGSYTFRANMYFVAAVLNIILTVVLSRGMGIIGAAIASGVTILISSGFILNWYYQAKVGLDMVGWWKSVFREILPMIVLCVIGKFLWAPFSGSGWGGLLLGILCWAVAFSFISYFVSANEYEKGLVHTALRRVTAHK